VGNPQFVNPATADFHLQATSPTIDQGSALAAPTSDFDGLPRPQQALYDIGAYEYASNPPGRVLDSLRLAKSGSNLLLSWSIPGGTCGAARYGVYRGTLPWTGYNHASLSCVVPGTSYTAPLGTGSYYFLVVPENNLNEGSYGTGASGSERPPAASPCQVQDTTPCN
jgi:hypothetical protein